ncbi:hypothetical protein N665_0494s0015 [Sinapis alba]|nr:hypothetical protein N665_0494s0015 [Sinapis alba]
MAIISPSFPVCIPSRETILHGGDSDFTRKRRFCVRSTVSDSTTGRQLSPAPATQFRKAARVRWPGLFQGVDSALEEWIVDQMHIVRPVVETGY